MIANAAGISAACEGTRAGEMPALTEGVVWRAARVKSASCVDTLVRLPSLVLLTATHPESRCSCILVEMMHAEIELMESIKMNERNIAAADAQIKHSEVR